MAHQLSGREYRVTFGWFKTYLQASTKRAPQQTNAQIVNLSGKTSVATVLNPPPVTTNPYDCPGRIAFASKGVLGHGKGGENKEEDMLSGRKPLVFYIGTTS